MPFFQAKPIDIKLVGSTLVASFHRAQPPLVWRFDLERNHSFAIALQGEEGDWELGITSAKGEFYSIVHFVSREDADEALASVQKMLMKNRGSKLWCFVKGLFAILLIAVALSAVGVALYVFKPKAMSTIMSPASLREGAPMGALPTIPSAPPAALPSGIPLPADEVIKAPPQ